MKKRQNITIAVLVVLILLLTYLLLSNRQISWDYNYQPDSKAPYGTWVFHQLLERNAQTIPTEIIKKKLPEQLENRENALYVRIASNEFYDAQEIAAIKKFIAAGNTVFISMDYLPSGLLQVLLLTEPELDSIKKRHEPFSYIEIPDSIWEANNYDIDHDKWQDSVVAYEKNQLNHRFSLINELDSQVVAIKLWSGQALQLTNMQQFGPRNRNWSHFGAQEFQRDLKKATPHGYLNQNLVNYVSFKVGQGTVYLHTTPALFTNYHLRNEAVFDHVEVLVQSWGRPAVFLLDEQKREFRYNPSGAGRSPAPLSYILQHRSLRWAWYLLLLVALVYTASQVRRVQREIPVIPPLPNASIAFAQALGTLDLTRPYHPDIAKRAFKIFKNQAWAKLRLPDSDDLKTYEQQLLRLRPQQKNAIIRMTALLYIAEKHPENFVGPDLVELYNHFNKIQNTF